MGLYKFPADISEYSGYLTSALITKETHGVWYTNHYEMIYYRNNVF